MILFLRCPIQLMIANRTSSSPLKWEKYVALTATSLSTLSLAPGEASAAVVKVLDRPVALPSSFGSADWDVDGNGEADFRLAANFSTGFILSTSTFRGRGMVGPNAGGGNVSKLSSNFVVGPTLASKAWGAEQVVREVTYLGGAMSAFSFDGFQAGDNYFGFRFDKDGDGNLHYGFAVANINNPDLNANFTITKWAYNDVAGAPVTVGPLNADPVPDPSQVPGPIGLAGLAAGAAWSRRLRKRIRQAS
jgi:MYXO-CTERM domain-containing protein